MLSLTRLVGQSIVLSTSDGDIVVKVDRVEWHGREPRIHLAVSAPDAVKVTREPR